MTAAAVGAPAHPRPKLDLWLCWWTFPVFYALFGLIFVVLTKVMPPPRPGVTPEQVNRFFADHATTIKLGFAILLVCIGLAGVTNALVAVQMKRMSVTPVFAYAYIATLAVGAVPGCLFAAFSFLAAVFRPDRDPALVAMLYDVGLLTFVGSLGCFTANYLVLAIAIFLDENGIFPRWMAYITFWQVATELLAAPVFVFRKGAFAWNGAISFWEGTLIFVVFLCCLILLLRRAVARQPDGEQIPE
jgi:hypothetical protein